MGNTALHESREVETFHLQYAACGDVLVASLPSSSMALRSLVHQSEMLPGAHVLLHRSYPALTASCLSKHTCCYFVSWLFAGAESAVSMKRLISHMRKQRIGMVQTVQQYVFIYQAIYDEIREAFSDGRHELEPSPVSAPRRVSRSLSMASSSSQG